MKRPALAFFAAAACAAQFGCRSNADAAQNPDGYFKPGISCEDGKETFPGPARGYAPGGWIMFKPEGLPKWRGVEGYHSSLWELSRFSGGRVQDGHAIPANRVGGADIPLTDAMKADVRRFLEETRQKGGSLIVRLGYTWSESRGCEPSDLDVVLGHVKDLSQIMADFPDIVVGVEAGIAGPWGEMHSSDYCRPEYMNRVLKTYCDNLPPEISILTRTAKYISSFAGTNADGLLAMLPFQDGDLKRFGMYNDGYLGTWRDYGTWAGEWKRENGCRLLNALSGHPYGGELAYVGRSWLDDNRENCADLLDAGKWNIVKEWYETHLDYLRNIGDARHALCAFIEERTFDAEKFRFDGMPDLHEYDGLDMRKFMHDHMGYRFVVRDVRIPKRLAPGKTFLAAVEIENTGFGRLLLPSRIDVVLESDVRTFVLPAETVGCGLSEIAGAGKRRIGVRFTVPSELERGECAVSLRASSPLKDEKPGEMPRRPIRFANAGMWNGALKANFLGKVEVRR